ncbi:amidohydrolase family protein [Aquamicrobium defluvii]|uniref:Amidohydrolase-related domain-containing protein n=1 Tax=Aquamicrobium defluvii TaxID=69279 RepID=A0A011UGF6_9HYPH|nr:amidohydrolase family protein [Aquamicrobium defluvii]EXL04943.1 hypothetical protein BG36_08980 [Aquamicrobium defluvii]EZQ14622.1 hypothetical protein CF98_19070 [Halopseudomonas bauzanensis]
MLIKGAKALLTDGFDRVDVRTAGDVISEIGNDLTSDPGEEVIEASGKILTPGLIDMHAHTFTHGFHLALDADVMSATSGVTTFLDAGSAGAVGFPSFYEFIIKKARSRMYAYLNISILGQTISAFHDQSLQENDVRDLAHLPLAEEMLRRYPDVIKGLKVRVYPNMPGLYALEQARHLADKVGLPVMVHLGSAPPFAVDTLALLKRGDIITHPYHGGTDTLLDEKGEIREVFLEARARGIEVDLGMDRFHCDLSTMKKAFDQGFYPDYVSSDLTTLNIDEVTVDLPTCISKCVACGMDLDVALQKATSQVAQKLGITDTVGQISVGHVADLALFDWVDSTEPLIDFFGNKITEAKRLVHVLTIFGGERLRREGQQPKIWDSTKRAVHWANYD